MGRGVTGLEGTELGRTGRGGKRQDDRTGFNGAGRE